MKCIHCGHDSKYKERSDGRCSSCRKHFAFEPKRGDPFTDGAFKAAIDAVSVRGQVKWGVEHLYYEICRRKQRRGFTAFIRMLLPFLRRRHVAGSSDDAEFNRLWSRWREAHGDPTGLIVRKTQPKARKAAEADIGDYSFDRAVICDRARTVDLLVANNFHFENNCAVLAVGGYPEGPFETIRTMLKRNPKLHVFVLHDATFQGCELAHKLATDPQWFKGQGSVTDVGLRPAHAPPFESLLIAPSGPPRSAPTHGIGPGELAWLNQHALELAAIRPEQVLKRLFRAINRKEADPSDGGGDVSSGGYYGNDSMSFSSDASDSDGGADSFG